MRDVFIPFVADDLLSEVVDRSGNQFFKRNDEVAAEKQARVFAFFCHGIGWWNGKNEKESFAFFRHFRASPDSWRLPVPVRGYGRSLLFADRNNRAETGNAYPETVVFFRIGRGKGQGTDDSGRAGFGTIR